MSWLSWLTGDQNELPRRRAVARRYPDQAKALGGGARYFEPVDAISWLEANAAFRVAGMSAKLSEIVRAEIIEALREGRPFREISVCLLKILAPGIGTPEAELPSAKAGSAADSGQDGLDCGVQCRKADPCAATWLGWLGHGHAVQRDPRFRNDAYLPPPGREGTSHRRSEPEPIHAATSRRVPPSPFCGDAGHRSELDDPL